MPPSWVTTLPAINAGLNSLAIILLTAGYLQIKQGNREKHKKLMLTAFATSVLFLVCYLVYHFALNHYTGSSSKKFPGTGTIRTVYLGILLTHVVLAATVPVLAIITIVKGLREQWDSHKWFAKITFPIWLYVSVTGVIIYFMVYHWPVPEVAV
jgi:protein SCO1/2/putative membrane protein